jgi:SAM-dependent methyltransferase
MAKVAIERLDHSKWSPPWTQLEHLARYEFASQYVRDRIVVDCACGDGTSTSIFATSAKLAYGFDVSAESVNRAQQANRTEKAVFQYADATALPVEDRSAEVFVSLETIEHIQKDMAFLDEVVRIVGDEGIFICSTPDRDVYSPGNTLSSKPWNQFHVREYSAAEFSQMLHDRFQSVQFFGQNPTSPFTSRIKCKMGKVLSTNLAVRLNQVIKLQGFVWRRPGRHRVVPANKDRKYEYLVAVCSGVVRTAP